MKNNINKPKISIQNNFEARRKANCHKEIQKKLKKQNNNEPDSQLIYTFRENNEGGDDILEGSLNSNIHISNTIEADIKEKSIKMNKRDLFPENEMLNTITRNNKHFEQTLLSVKGSKKEFYNTGK